MFDTVHRGSTKNAEIRVGDFYPPASKHNLHLDRLHLNPDQYYAIESIIVYLTEQEKTCSSL